MGEESGGRKPAPPSSFVLELVHLRKGEVGGEKVKGEGRLERRHIRNNVV